MKLTKHTARPMTVEYVRCGPFIVAFHRGNKGDHFIARMLEPMDRKDAIYRGMLVKGHMRSIEVPDGAIPTPDYTEGMTSDQRPPITHAGRYVLEVTEDDTLFLCLQRKNKLAQWQKFSYEWVKLPANEICEVRQGRIFALGDGKVTDGRTLYKGPYVLWSKSKTTQLTVLEPARGIIVWADNEG